MTRILIIEDDFALAESLQALLKSKGYEVSFAPDGLQGLEMARKGRPDLILLDVLIPRVNGYEVCRQLRTEPKTKEIRIVMVTGLGTMRDVEKAFACGATDYIIKPFNTDRLLKKIEKVMGSGPTAS
ncbi:MAG: response regulator [Elusimicrobiota bacterium]|jgi:DNA-binding response OmpR family regulator